MLQWRKQFALYLFKICTEINKNRAYTSETAAHNFYNVCNETLGALR